MSTTQFPSWMEGSRAYNSGIKVGDNPWPEDDQKHWRWMQGWASAGLLALQRKPRLTHIDLNAGTVYEEQEIEAWRYEKKGEPRK